MFLRRLSLLILAAFLAGCASQRTPLAARVDQSLSRAKSYLLARQSPDGAWRSTVYGFFKDGPTLSPHVLAALLLDDNLTPATDLAADYLASLIDAGGNLRGDATLIYPVYTASEAVIALGRAHPAPARLRARSAWLALLRQHHLADPLGWRPEDVDYGGWGYAPEPPPRPTPGGFHGPWDWSNLSATAYALQALRSAKIGTEDPVYDRALRFVQHCQRFRFPVAKYDDATDGGFFFAPSSPMRNKAGGESFPDGRAHFNPYGSMTCDGLLAMLDCGLPADHPRVAAARAWLEKNFTVEHNPGRFVEANEDLRDATYYYYARSLASVLLRLQSKQVTTPHGKVGWPAALAEELLRRQRPDGSWANPFTDGKEDDPVVATPLAIEALAACRDALKATPSSR